MEIGFTAQQVTCTSTLLAIFYLFTFWPCLKACGILVPQPGIEPGPLAMKEQSPNHWTAWEFPVLAILERRALFCCVKFLKVVLIMYLSFVIIKLN